MSRKTLAQLGAELKRLERGDLRRELLKSIRTQTRPLLEAARRSALDTLPKQGGLNQIVANSKMTSRTSLSARSARVRLVASNQRRLRTLDKGVVRHPTYGHDPWVSQQIPPEWWTRPMEEGSPHVRAAIVRTVDDISRRL